VETKDKLKVTLYLCFYQYKLVKMVSSSTHVLYYHVLLGLLELHRIIFTYVHVIICTFILWKV
jgi:hypothetical protein